MPEKLTRQKLLARSIRNLKINSKKEFVSCANRIYEVDNSIRPLDLIAHAALNRGLNIVMGFAHLAEKQDYIAAIPLLRIQLDTALRFFASTLVSDYNKFSTEFIAGKQIRNMKSKDGKPMTDNYLATEMQEYFPGIMDLYKAVSGHIHFSNEHLFQNTTLDPNNKRKFTMNVRYHNPYKIGKKLEAVDTMTELSKLVIVSVEQWKHHKIELKNDQF